MTTAPSGRIGVTLTTNEHRCGVGINEPAIEATRGRLRHVGAAAEAEVVVAVALLGHELRGVPVLRAPAAVVLVGLLTLEDEPAPLHLRRAGPALARELGRGGRGEGQV